VNIPSIAGAKRCQGQVGVRSLAVILVIIVLLVVGWFLLRPAPPPEPAPDPGLDAGLETVAPAESSEERGDRAREVIAELEARPGGADYAEAYREAQQFRETGRQADAQLLLFFAARGGHGPAAFELAASYDPTRVDDAATPTDSTDPFQAYKWYSAARDAGDAGDTRAVARLDALRDWTERAAADGDLEAERLLMQWK